MGYEVQNVRDAARRFRLSWPVLADIDGSVWKAYNSNVWLNRYLVDQNGEIVMHVEGETNNHALEEKIHELLVATHSEVAKIALDPDENAFMPQSAFRRMRRMWATGSDGARSRIPRDTTTDPSPISLLPANRRMAV
jgi:hypothetical protein